MDTSQAPQLKVKIGIIGLVMLLSIASVVIKVALDSRREYRTALLALSQNEPNQAMVHLERCIHYYTPLNGSVRAAVQKIWAMGEQAEANSQPEQALLAYRTLRSSLYAIRSFYTPYETWIARCDGKIATLVAEGNDYASRYPDRSLEEKKGIAAEILQRNPPPGVFWAIIVEIGFLGWVFSALLFIFRALRYENRLLARPALLYGGLTVLFYAVWIVGMMYA
jgi:hypothetical protein